MSLSLRVKLSAAFVGIAFFVFIIISILANVVLERQFKEYTIEKLEQNMKDTVSLIAERYGSWGNEWNLASIENIGVNALGEGLIIRVKGSDNSVVWDARKHNNGMCMSILRHMSENMQSLNPNFKGGYEEKNYPVVFRGNTVGSVDIGYYGPYFYSDLDIQYLATLNNLLLWAALISLVVCLGFGTYMAKRLTSPIARVVKTAGKIAKGDFNDRIDERSSTKEIIELTDSVNSLAQSLGKQEILRKRLTADVAHELRTPLATLQSHVEAFIDGVWEPDQQRLKSFHEEILRLSKLVGELEKLSQFEGDNLVLHKERFDISDLIESIVANFAGEFKNKGIEVELDLETQNIEADKDKISQVMINLMSNALKYTPEGGKVKVTVNGFQDAVKVVVHDTGIGISPEDLPHIFERFYRTDKSRNRATGGAGIGLTIAKSIIDAHKGSITAESEINKGSTFTVILPKLQL